MKSVGFVGLVALALSWGGTVPSVEAESEKPPPPSSSSSRVPPAPLDHDLLRIRNIFRYADEAEARLDPRRGPGDSTVEDPTDEVPDSPRARLVGLVARSGGLVAALSIDGEVLLLAEGASARGFTVLEISEEAVQLRGPEGDEETLQLP